MTVTTKSRTTSARKSPTKAKCKPRTATKGATASIEAKPVAATANWYQLMDQALAEPAQLFEARKYFHQYSLANRWLASTQLRAAGLPLEPINTFNNWKNVGRIVQTGQKATVALNMPVPVRAPKSTEAGSDERGDIILFTKFILKKHWFTLSQTAGDEYVPAEISGADWHLPTAMKELGIVEQEFVFASVSDIRDSCSVGQTISVSPLAPNQVVARIREMSRVLLDHTAAELPKAVPTDLVLQGLEADACAYLCAASVGVEGLDDIRARLQVSLAENAMTRIPEKCLNRAFKIAHKLVDAGYC